MRFLANFASYAPVGLAQLTLLFCQWSPVTIKFGNLDVLRNGRRHRPAIYLMALLL